MKFFSKLARRLNPYTAGEQPQDKKYVKLNTNENPFPPSGRVADALAEFDIDRLKLYPDPESHFLCAAIAEAEGIDVENIICGNGSDELLSFAFAAFFVGSKPVLFADVTYSFYPVYCDFYGIPYRLIRLSDDFSINSEDYCGAHAGGIIIANPNAPTSLCIGVGEIERIAASNKDKVVLIDEAYADFCGQSALPLTVKYDNLLVVRTFSKSYSLAGLRVGYAVGNSELIRTMRRVKDSFNSYPVDALAMRLAAAAVLDRQYHAGCIERIVATRDRVIASLRGIGFLVLRSGSNFIFAKPPVLSGEEFYLKLKERGVLVRHFNKDRIKDFVRVSVGSDEQMDIFLSAAAEIIGL